MRSVIAIMLGLLVPVAPVLADPLPFRDGRYLSMPDLCGLSDEGIVERIGDEIHYILYDINGRNFSGAEFHCEVRSVNTRGSTVEFQAACAMEGEVNDVTMTVTSLSPTSFQEGDRIFSRCE